MRSVANGTVWDYESVTDDYGFYTVPTNLLPGSFDWRVKNSQTLANGDTTNLNDSTNNVDMGTLREGDANNDNAISIIDFNMLKVTYGKGPQDPGYDPRADFTGDSAVNIQDFNMVKINYGQSGTPQFTTPTPGTTSTPSSTPISTNTPTNTPTNIPTDTATSTLTETPTNTPTIAAGVNMIGHVTIAGRSAPPSVRQSVLVTVELRLQTGGSLISYSGYTDNYGYITVTGGLIPAPGTYNWRIKNPQTLALSGNATLATGDNQVEMGIFKEGDASNDNAISIIDFNIVKVTYGKGPQDPGYDPRADFTGDDAINIQDFNALKVNYGQSGAPPITPFNLPPPKGQGTTGEAAKLPPRFYIWGIALLRTKW